MDVSVTTVPCGSEPVHELQSHLDTIKPYAYDLSTETDDSVENKQDLSCDHGHNVEGYVSFVADDIEVSTEIHELRIDEYDTECRLYSTHEEPDDLGENQFVEPSRSAFSPPYVVKERILKETQITIGFRGLPVQNTVDMSEGQLDITVNGHTITFDNALAVEHGMELAYDEEVEHYVDFMCIGEAR